MVIVDTGVWIDYFGGAGSPQTAWLHYNLSIEAIGLTDLNLCELLQGVRIDREAAKLRNQLWPFEIFSICTLQLAVDSASNYRRLRGRGFTIRSSIDCLIATFCIENGHALLHRERDFDPFERHLGLRVIHPPSHPLQ